MRLQIHASYHFIQWLTTDHPSQDGKVVALIENITIANKGELAESWLKDEILAGLAGTSIKGTDPSVHDGNGIVAVHGMTPSGVVRLD